MEVKQNVKVLFISSPKTWRGGDQQLLYLMEKLHEQKIPFILVCPEGSELHKRSRQRGFHTAPFRKRGLLNISLARHIRKVCRKEKIRLVHANDSHAHTAAVLASIQGRPEIPIVLHRRVDFAVKNSFFSRYKYNHPSIKAIICISGKVKEILEPAIKDKSKLHIVYSAIDPQRFAKQEHTTFSFRAINSIPADFVLVTMVAALAPHKDYPTFIETAREVCRQRDNICFAAVGEGSLMDSIKDLAASYGLKDKVLFTGFISNVPEVLAETDVFLLTSKTEGMGTSILDAMAAGVPVVATRVGGIPEIVEDGVSGLQAESGDYQQIARHIINLADDHQLKNKLTTNATQMLTRFSTEEMASKTIDLYSKILFDARTH